MRIAFVVQRYGVEVNGGAEVLCRWVAERMQRFFDIEVLTTCALDYLSWANHYPAGETRINNVIVRRFPVDVPRDMNKFIAFDKALQPERSRRQRALVDELTWIKLQGPSCPSLLTFIKEHETNYDLFVFVTYSYLTTFLGIQLVPRKSILIPAAHDEPHFYFTAYQPMFHLPLGIIYNTREEQRLVHQTWQNAQIPSCIAGAGVENHAAANVSLDFLPEQSPYLLYIGRIDVMKGCRELIGFFLKYLRERRSDVHLVLLGKPNMEIPQHPNIHAPGFVSEAQKDAAIRRAAVLVNPSEYESLSLVVLEAWQAGTPVLVTGRSDVLVDHCLTSNGGLYYSNYEEFALCVDMLLADEHLRRTLGAHGKSYVEQHYSWNTVEKTYLDFFAKVS